MPIPRAKSPVARRTLADEVYSHIYDAIIEGRLQPGEELNDKEIGAQFGVSRTPVREALKKLSLYRLVEMVPSKYTRVALRDERRLIEASNTLYCLYLVALREGIPAADSATKARLTELLEQLRVGGVAGNYRVVGEKSYEYVWQLVEASGNDALQATLNRLVPQATMALAPRDNLTPAAEIWRGFEQVHACVLEGDVAGAVGAMYELTAPAREQFLALAHAGGTATPAA
ncbi:GntR family transcriptional regulator [Leucobacter albus]|uniref:GntR family transcriptional regulator n=1 Tax=Leucobacter albus TaxID=272210 RepID=A0ABW3TNH2_9MICO